MSKKHSRKGIRLTSEDKLESWCSWHLNEDRTAEHTELNKQQKRTLLANIKAKLNQLLDQAITAHLGRPASVTEMKMELNRVKHSDTKIFYHWGEIPILFITEPRSRITEMTNKQGGRYYLTWYARILAINQNN